jgi:hypothetical protein
MHARHLLLVCGACLAAGGFTFAQVGRGGTQWPAPLGDAQRTSWVRTDDKISVQSLTRGGFELQWKAALDNQPRGGQGLGQGITASGVTLFVPMSVVTGSSNTVYGIDNDLGYVVWKRQFTAALPAATAECPGGIASGATRLVRLDATPAPGFGGFGGRGNVGYRTLLGEPGEGVPLGGRGAARGAAPPPPPAGRQGGAPPPAAPAGRQGGAPGGGGGRGAQPDRIPGAPAGGPTGGLARPSGVAYVISSDGMLHVMGLASGKDIQRPAQFVPANSRWSSPVAVDTTLYAATSSACAGAPSAVWAIDLDSDAKPVVSWKTNGGDVVGAVAFTSDGMLVAATSTAIVALDPKTLQPKGSFSEPNTQFATGPTILRHAGKDIVAAATKDGRVLLLDAASLAGAKGTLLFASKPFVGAGGSVSADALAAWVQTAPVAPPAPGAAPVPGGAQALPPTPIASWILLPVAGRLAATVTAANGPVSTGAVVALKIADSNGSLSLEPAWTSHDLSGASTPLAINGVVFALAKGQSSTKTPAVLHAYDGVTGKRLWNSGKSMSTVASPGSLWTGLGQIYVGAVDGTAHAFGFLDERR